MQQQTECNLWGWAKENSKVKVTVEWAKNAYTAVADKDGKWKVSIQTPEAGGPYTIKISDSIAEIPYNNKIYNIK